MEKVLRVGRTIGYPLCWCFPGRDLMLRSIRHNIKYLSITLWLVIASFIATIFLVWGMQSAGPGSGRDVAVAATVNGERISRLEFQRAYEREREALRQLYGDRWNEDLARDLAPPRRGPGGRLATRSPIQVPERHGLSVSRE